MAKYIRATTAAEIISEKLGVRLSDMVDIMAAVPTEDVQPVVHGKWIACDDALAKCSKCNYIPPYDGAIDDIYCPLYCPNCGARMDL